jgi:hypothetical protein
VDWDPSTTWKVAANFRYIVSVPDTQLRLLKENNSASRVGISKPSLDLNISNFLSTLSQYE